MENKGKVYAFETDTVWGLGANIKDEAGVKKIYELKKRESQKPLILMSNSIENIEKYIKPLSSKAKDLIQTYMPGALTIIVEKSEIFPKYLNPEFDTVGVRIPNHKGFAEFCKKNSGMVLATTSANISGEKPLENLEEIKKEFKNNVEIVEKTALNLNKNTPSTIVLIQDNSLKVLREGDIKIN